MDDKDFVIFSLPPPVLEDFENVSQFDSITGVFIL